MSLFVFFFKQKTAYEMRISDWISDVCSADLPGFRHHAKRGRRLVAFAVDHRGKPKQVLLLAVAAGHHMAALADPERDLAHQCSLPFSSRSNPATAASARVRSNW